MSDPKNLRILVVDDQESIREDYKKILGAQAAAPALTSARMAFLGGSATATSPQPAFELTLASQGDQGVELVERA